SGKLLTAPRFHQQNPISYRHLSQHNCNTMRESFIISRQSSPANPWLAYGLYYGR
ncbi:hypothetical protein COCVIDRAFT_83338, partial [Bipolaris victoriae FI3]